MSLSSRVGRVFSDASESLFGGSDFASEFGRGSEFAPGGQGYLFQACLRGEYLILAYPYVGTTVGPTVIPNLSISSHQHPAEPVSPGPSLATTILPHSCSTLSTQVTQLLPDLRLVERCKSRL